MAKGIVKCRICKEDHWTTQCPYKDTLLPVQEALNKVKLFKSSIICYWIILTSNCFLISRLKRRKLLRLLQHLVAHKLKVVRKEALM